MSMPRSPYRRLDRIWIALTLATALTWWMGKLGATGPLAVSAVLAIAGAKGVYIALDFMALRDVRLLWRALVLGWLALVLGLIGLAYRAGLG
jgi:caa(3)-type oxidase subunit IV